MTLELRRYGTTFATRQKAREVTARLPSKGQAVSLNAAGVMASPSFISELLLALSERYSEVTIEGASDRFEYIAQDLARKMGLDSVRFVALT